MKLLFSSVFLTILISPSFAQDNFEELSTPFSSPKKNIIPLNKNKPEFDLDYEKATTQAYNDYLLSLKHPEFGEKNKVKSQSSSEYNMPIVKLKANDNMPIIKPDSTINYHILQMKFKSIKPPILSREEK
ncbi:MAG: hypothetical protein KTR26_17300 [Flammeovirgaceae bacterium]|nr:hypothetical protein [Flammeovirgaceae bacterium]